MPRIKNIPQPPANMPALRPDRVAAFVAAQDETGLTLVEAKAHVRALALQLGYDGALSVGTLEDEIRFYQRRSVEALLESGKRLLLLKELAPHGEFEQRVELLGFHIKTAQRFMNAAAKASKSDKLSFLSTQVKNASAFLELVTHDDGELEALTDLDAIERMSASELRAALRQANQDNEFSGQQLQKERERADKAEKKLGGRRPVVVPLDERITPFQVEITERQSLIEKAITAHVEAVAALDAWWTEEVTSRPDYDPEQAVEMPRPVGLVLMHLVDATQRLASLVGALQHALDERFAGDISQARQYLMREQGADEGGSPDGKDA